MRRFKRGEKGFTLIEVLVVVAILGVLAAVVVPRIDGIMGSGKEEAAESELHSIQTALTAVMVDNDWTSVNAKTGVSTFSAPAASDDANNANCDVEVGAGNMGLYPNYLSLSAAGAQQPDGTLITYSWTSDGIVTPSYSY